jgi:hypothetical protein
MRAGVAAFARICVEKAENYGEAERTEDEESHPKTLKEPLFRK